ncbi:MAG: hypothetical protein ACM3XZ_02725 [Betaproteobacteria bacterium]
MDPIKQLARTLDARALKSAARVAVHGAELGTITATGLKLDRFKHEIPRGKYLVAHYLTLGWPFHTTVEPQTGSHPHGPSGSPVHTHPGTEGAHDHRVVNPEQLRPLQPGDRVLAIPVNDGREFAVVARVVVHGA